MPSASSLRRSLTTALVAGLAASLALVVCAPGVVAAHNTFESSDPADGSVLAASPPEITMVFTKSVPLATTTVILIDTTGARTEITALRHGAAGDNVVVATLPQAILGEVTIRWTLVGPDGHPITGRIGFTVEASPQATPAVTAPAPPATEASGSQDEPSLMPDAVRWLLRWLSYAAMFLLVAIVLTDALLWKGVAASRRWQPWLGRCTAAIAALAVLQLLVLAADIAGGLWPTVAGLETAGATDVGLALVTRAFLAGAVWLVLRMQISSREVRSTALVVAGAALLGTWAYAGHAKSLRWPWVGVPVDVVHHLAAAFWIGALLVVALGAGAVAGAELAPVMRRFSRLAALAVAVIVGTGVVQSLRLHGSPADLFDTRHGTLLVTKVVLLVVMLVLADRNRRWVATACLPGAALAPAAVSGLRRAMLIEFATGVVVVGVTAALVASPLG